MKPKIREFKLDDEVYALNFSDPTELIHGRISSVINGDTYTVGPHLHEFTKDRLYHFTQKSEALEAQEKENAE